VEEEEEEDDDDDDDDEEEEEKKRVKEPSPRGRSGWGERGVSGGGSEKSKVR
jgi:hypothetical protein